MDNRILMVMEELVEGAQRARRDAADARLIMAQQMQALADSRIEIERLKDIISRSGLGNSDNGK